jgi:hypothetical protein
MVLVGSLSLRLTVTAVRIDPELAATASSIRTLTMAATQLDRATP